MEKIPIRFEVQWKSGQRADNIGSVRKPKNYPCFVLNYNYDWNDYGYSNWYALFYFHSEQDYRLVGELKLMTREDVDAIQYIKDGFSYLTDNFCSIGLDISYYANLHEMFGTDGAKNVLTALRDSAVNVEIHEQFQNNGEYNTSLMRDLTYNKIRKEASSVINGVSLENLFSFTYHFTTEYDDSINVVWNVVFKYKAKPWERYVGVIGENGLGKTQLLRSFVKDLYANGNKFQIRPSFSNVIAIHSTPFDAYDEVQSTDNTMPYHSFSIEQDRNNVMPMMMQAIIKTLHRGLINKESIVEVFKKELNMIIGSEWADRIIYKVMDENEEYEIWEYSEDQLSECLRVLSSGQLHLFMLLSHVFANANLNTLFILDEPEVHLHPKAIMDFLGIFGKILSVFDSYAIIATHSPLVIREMRGQNVFLMQRMNDGSFSMSTLPFETFGENIASLYQSIFNYDEKTSLFSKAVRQMVNEGNSFDDINRIMTDKNGLSFNASMIINNEIMRKNRNEESSL